MQAFSFKEWLLLIEAAIDERYPFKAVFMAGGPGSGKTWVSNKMFGGLGLSESNSDEIMKMMARRGGEEDVVKATAGGAGYDRKQQLQGQAMSLTQRRTAKWQNNGIPYRIDITGRNINLVKTIKEQLESRGYDTYMVFVRTSLETAQSRNQGRATQPGQHVADDEFLSQAWQGAMDNLNAYQEMFGSNFMVVDNDEANMDARILTVKLHRMGMRLLGQPGKVNNPIGQQILSTMTPAKPPTTPAMTPAPAPHPEPAPEQPTTTPPPKPNLGFGLA